MESIPNCTTYYLVRGSQPRAAAVRLSMSALETQNPLEFWQSPEAHSSWPFLKVSVWYLREARLSAVWGEYHWLLISRSAWKLQSRAAADPFWPILTHLQLAPPLPASALKRCLHIIQSELWHKKLVGLADWRVWLMFWSEIQRKLWLSELAGRGGNLVAGESEDEESQLMRLAKESLRLPRTSTVWEGKSGRGHWQTDKTRTHQASQHFDDVNNI